MMLDQSYSTVPALYAAEHSEMLCCRACWEEERCVEHHYKDIILCFCLPGEASPVLNDLSAVYLCALLECRYEHFTKVQIMIRLYSDMLQHCENIVWEFRNFNCLFVIFILCLLCAFYSCILFLSHSCSRFHLKYMCGAGRCKNFI